MEKGIYPTLKQLLWFSYILLTAFDITYQKCVRRGKVQTASVTLSAPLPLIEFPDKLSP